MGESKLSSYIKFFLFFENLVTFGESTQHSHVIHFLTFNIYLFQNMTIFVCQKSNLGLHRQDF